MPLVECPHCRHRVGLTEGTICPACKADTADLTGVNPNLTTVWVAPGHVMPGVCVECGVETKRTSAVTGYASELEVKGAGVLARISVLVLSSVSKFFLVLQRLLGETRLHYRARKMRIRVPRCRRCFTVIEPIRLNEETGAMKVLVHRQFALELRTLNPNRQRT